MGYVVFSSRASFYYLCNSEVQSVVDTDGRLSVHLHYCYIVNSESLSVLKMACHESTRSFLLSISK